MKIEDMTKHFKEKNCGVGTFSSEIVSTSQNAIFRQMVLNDAITMAKSMMETPGSQTAVLNALLQRMAIQGLAFDTITELDRIHLFASMKKSTFIGKEEPSIKFKCNRCSKEFVFTLDVDVYMSKIKASHLPNKIFSSNENTIMTIGIPSASCWELWMKHTDTIRNQIKNEKAAEEVISRYSFMPYIKSVQKINGIILDTPFDTITFDKKIELIGNMPVTQHQQLEEFMIAEKFTSIKYGIIYEVKCASCASMNNVLVGPSHFFL